MSQDDEVRKAMIARFKPFIARAGGGIFTRKTRERLLGIRVPTGRDRTKNDFWYDVRNRVKNSLVDLQIFVETAGNDQINQVITRESLEPLFLMLLREVVFSGSQPDPVRAEIADLLILQSFRHLKDSAKGNITLSHERTISEAVDLSDYLLHAIKKTPYYTPSDSFGIRGRI